MLPQPYNILNQNSELHLLLIKKKEEAIPQSVFTALGMRQKAEGLSLICK